MWKNKKLKITVGLFVITSLLLAQQPIQLQTVNGGGAVALGHGTAATALRVELPTDGTGIVGLAAGSNVIGSVSQNGAPWGMALQPSASSTYAFTSSHATTSTSTYTTLKGSAGNLYGVDIGNPNTTPCVLVFYNNAAPTIGTTSIVQGFWVQAGTSKALPPGSIALNNFSTAITYAATTTDGGASVCTTAMTVDFWYQ